MKNTVKRIDISPRAGIIRMGVKFPLMCVFDTTNKIRPSYVIATFFGFVTIDYSRTNGVGVTIRTTGTTDTTRRFLKIRRTGVTVVDMPVTG